jgi:hypothetical protein
MVRNASGAVRSSYNRSTWTRLYGGSFVVVARREGCGNPICGASDRRAGPRRSTARASMMHVEAFHDGDFPSAVVLVDGERLDPGLSQDVWNHSPDGFAWGYNGSGPAQLALALLLQAGLHPDVAVRLHQQFKREFIVARPQDESWAFDMDVLAWARSKQAPDSGSG